MTGSRSDPPLVDVQAHLAAIIESSDDAIVTTDLTGTILSWNRGATKLYGYTAEEVVGRSVSVLIPAARSEELAGTMAELAAGVKVDHLKSVRVRKDGSAVPVSLTISPIRDASGRITAASTIARDISDRVRLTHEAEHLQGILDAANDALIGMSSDGVITEWNRAAEDLFGWAAAEAVGRHLGSTIIPERYREAHEQGLRRYLRSGVGSVIGQRLELAALHRDGHEIPVELSVFVTTAGDTPAFNAFVHDISERARLTSALERARDRALEASRMKSDFLATMSHEIRTPLNGVIGMTGLLLDTPLDEEQREFADTVRRSGETLLTIINDILDFSKIEAGRLDLEVIDFDLRTVIEEVADLLAGQAHAKGIELATLVRPDVPTAVRGDPGRIRQVLTNLVANAIKFTSAGEVVVRAIETGQEGELVVVRIEVSDTGIGIDPHRLTALFEPFTQADSSTTRTYGGTGLGLAISKRLVDLMGGDIDVTSEIGRGSTFAFTLRLTRQPEGTPTRRRAELGGLRVLIVDDNATNRTILTRQTASWGMQVTSVESGAAALEVLRAAREGGGLHDVGLIDMDMPGMDGLELARAVRADPALPDIPLLLLTSSVSGSPASARDAGFNGHLTKPVRQSQLFDTIATVIGAQTRHVAFGAGNPVAGTRSRPRLLVAEDNIVNQQVAVAMLDKLGYRADVVADGAEALEALSRIPYGAVLMDCQMPEMDGYAATAQIRRTERGGQHIPIIAMTAGASSGERERCQAAGMDDYIAKPVYLDDLADVLRRWVAQD